MCIGGAQWILSGAAIHGAIELSRNSLQHQFLPVKLSAAIQEAAAHSRPREHGFWEDLILWVRAGNSGVIGEHAANTGRPEAFQVPIFIQ